MDEYINQIRARVFQRMDLSRDMLDEEIEEFISEETAQMLQGMIISLRERVRIEQQVFNSLRKLDALQDLVDDPEVSEIMVNGPKDIYVEIDGKLIKDTSVSFINNEHIIRTIQRLIGPLGRTIDGTNPMVDSRLKDGSRINAVIPPLSVNGPVITIRKFKQNMTKFY